MDNHINLTNCFVCVEKFNLSNRAIIICEYCDFIACRSCYETYLLSQSTPHCMKSNEECGKIWSRKFMSNNFTIKFIKTKYKKHQEQILFERELALMPETQIIIERKINKENKINRCEEEINEINNMINELIDKRRNLEDKKNEILYGNEMIDDDEDEGEDEDEEQETKSEEKQKKNKRKFTHRCSNENCRGFLSSKWKCNLCETWTCSQCQVNIGTNQEKLTHICDDNDLETAKLIRKDSKPCPKCGIIIFKISGCDQMYCTQCNTPFSWNTGMIETGIIHNPHYYEYLRTMGQDVPRNPLDIVNRCERTLNNHFIQSFNHAIQFILVDDELFYLLDGDTIAITNMLKNLCKKILNICQNINHLIYYVMFRMRIDVDSKDQNREYFRILYLKNSMSEEDFKKNIQIIEKNYQKNIEFMNLYTMIRDTITDNMHIIYNKFEQMINDNNIRNVINKFKRSMTTDKEYVQLITEGFIKYNINEENILLEFSNLQTYANNCLTDISRTYHCVHKEFNDDFKLQTK
jgi:hypothetical protein